jgi:hypothetical protein
LGVKPFNAPHPVFVALYLIGVLRVAFVVCCISGAHITQYSPHQVAGGFTKKR